MTAAALLILCLTRHYLWDLVEPKYQADLWNICGSVVILALLFGRGEAFKATGAAKFVALWWLAEELMVIGCSSLFIFRPWFVQLGTAQCVPLLGYFDLGKLGMLFAAMAAWRIKLQNL